MTRLRRGLHLLVYLLIGCARYSGTAGAQTTDLVFRDGYETTLPECLAGASGGTTLPLPELGGAELVGCFEVRNDELSRSEVARGAVPVARELALRDTELARLVVIGPGPRRWPTQFQVLSRWGQPLANTDAPVRWLAAALSVELEADSQAQFAVLRLPLPPTTPDPGALQLSGTETLRVIDTGLAEFTLAADAAQPVVRIRVRSVAGAPLQTLFERQPGSADEGLAMRARLPDGTLLLDAHAGLPGSILTTATRWETGPVRTVMHLDGHFEQPGAVLRCADNPSNPRFPLALTIAVERGSRKLDFEWHLGNACGLPQAAATAERVQIEHAQFALPLARLANGPISDFYHFGESAAAGTGVRHGVRQVPGGGQPWRRTAAAFGSTGVTAEFASLYAAGAWWSQGLPPITWTALASQPWMRYREPQALESLGGRLVWRLIDAPVTLGKAKSLWFAGQLRIDLQAAVDVLAASRESALRSRAALERGLLLRPLPASLDAAAVLPPFSGGLTSRFGQAYREYLLRKQDDTIGDEPCPGNGGDGASQWVCGKTFGAQLWPDIPLNLQFGYEDISNPAANELKLNYWDPAHIELSEFQRSGDPRWFWNFAWPQSKLMVHTAYYHFGAARGSNIAGHSFGSGGSGDGLWHRSDSGSADYTYNRHQGLAYVLRPGLAERDRMAAAGHAAGLRFSNDPGDDTSWAAIGRLNLQYLESLANCAQFVPGNAGVQCDARLRQVLGHLINQSLSSGLMCERMLNAGSSCFLGQFFMLQAWYYPLLERWYLNWGHGFPAEQAQAWQRALVETPVRVLSHLPRDGTGAVDVNALWPNALVCTLSGAGFTQVQNCSVIPDPDNLQQNKPALVSLLVRAHARDPNRGLCQAARQIGERLFTAGGDALGFLRQVARGGWWKGAAEAGQELGTAALGFERCSP